MSAAGRRLRALIWAALAAGLVVLGVKTFVGDVYRVGSSSMEPVCSEGELVFVLHDRSTPDRFDLVVARRGPGDYLVKRAVGIGGPIGEDVQIDHGDLRVNGQRLPPEVTRPAPVPLFDDRILPLEDHFNHGDVWRRDERGVLVLDARDVSFGANAGLLRYHRRLHDGYLCADGEQIEGQDYVGDAVVEAEFVVTEPGGRMRVSLIEQGDTFEFAVDLGQEGTARATLRRERFGAETLTLEETLVPFEAGVPIRLRLANVDNHLSIDWRLEDAPAPPVAQATYESNTPDPRDRHREGKSYYERITFGGEGCRLELHHLRILRDVHWTRRDTYGVERELALQPGELYLLGDNSAHSTDSRRYGPLPADQVVGKPVLVVWPPSAIRRVR